MSPVPRSPDKPAGYGKAAKRLSGWAANLLASGLVLVIGLALGRQVLEWWQADSAQPDAKSKVLASDPGELGSLDRPHLLELGSVPFTLRRDTVLGDKAAAFAALRAGGQKTVSEPLEPRGQAGPAERRMLSQIKSQKPTSVSAGRWELYELDGPILMVAGVQFFASEDRTATERRVVFWGLAVPHGVGYPEKEARWTLFSFHPTGGAAKSALPVARLTLPGDLPVTLSLATEDGSQVIGFRASGDSAALGVRMEQSFSKQGWKLAGPWKQDGGAWQGKFEGRGGVADVQWSSDVANEFVGLVTVTPTSP